MKKIKKVIILAHLFIVVAVILSLSLSSLLFLSPIKDWVKIILFLIVFVCLMLGLGYLINKFFCMKLKKVKQKDRIVFIDCDLSTMPIEEALSNGEKNYVLYKKKRFLDTLSLLYIVNNSIDVKKIKSIIKSNNSFIKNRFKEAKETNPTKCHWNLKINMLVVNDETKQSEMRDVIGTLNKDQLYEIGKFTFAYFPNVKIAIFPIYQGDELNIQSLLKYIKSIKMICKFSSYPSNYFFDKL